MGGVARQCTSNEASFWNSTAIFVMWDDWGGWFDRFETFFRDYDRARL